MKVMFQSVMSVLSMAERPAAPGRVKSLDWVSS